MKISELIASGDWKGEKHVPVIEAPEKAAVGEAITVGLSVGAQIAHPNTTEHHICWIKLFFKPEKAPKPFCVGELSFEVHGESGAGANQGPVYCEPFGSLKVKLKESGTLIAMSYCNIHGLWESSRDIVIE